MYVDDGRQCTSRMPLGMRYNQKEEIFEVTMEARIEDVERKEENCETDSQRMARVCLPCMKIWYSL